MNDEAVARKNIRHFRTAYRHTLLAMQRHQAVAFAALAHNVPIAEHTSAMLRHYTHKLWVLSNRLKGWRTHLYDACGTAFLPDEEPIVVAPPVAA